ncbi:hypothetical protein FF011L_38840 [Roseimaritima multifibrata]|uniref:Uncharacterized protein n=1 Tax=Roseimaritima multifibrata TaxID=1930274 RepID=A0A517MJT3_9BACT|nr:hypothetical protein [Roseimaritima multifibrata]QDS95100.1 hypothetical protein FF011L_38840 [Roseimaritima multifibrata]
MITRPNDGGGTTLVLDDGDDLACVPDSHRDMITDSVQDALSDPAAYFSRIASRTTIPNLRKYLANFVADGRWSLLLADTYMMDRETIAAFEWFHLVQHACMFGTPTSDCEDDCFASFYDCLSMVHWDSIGFAGGIVPYCNQISLDDCGIPSINPTFPADTTMVFGNSPCGDMMICNSSGDAGYLSHENGASYVVGSFSEMLDWIFGELIQNRTPEFDYSRC